MLSRDECLMRVGNLFRFQYAANKSINTPTRAHLIADYAIDRISAAFYRFFFGCLCIHCQWQPKNSSPFQAHIYFFFPSKKFTNTTFHFVSWSKNFSSKNRRFDVSKSRQPAPTENSQTHPINEGYRRQQNTEKETETNSCLKAIAWFWLPKWIPINAIAPEKNV